MLQLIFKRRHILWLTLIATASLLTASVSGLQQNKFEIPTASAAQADYFLKLEGVDGESTDGAHRGEIDIQSWSWGASNPGISRTTSGGGGGAGKASFSDISFTTSIGKATPKLMLMCATGEHIKSAILFVRKAGSTQEYYTIELKEVMVSSYQVAGDGNEETNTFSLSFQKIEMTYIPQNPDGTTGEAIKAGWDLGKNKKI